MELLNPITYWFDIWIGEVSSKLLITCNMFYVFFVVLFFFMILIYAFDILLDEVF